jgi:tripartite motif-containing protein 71
VGGIATDSDNHLYLADNSNKRIQKFTSDGIYLSQWGTEGTGPRQFKDMAGLTVSSDDGFVYVLDPMNYRLQKFTADGVFLTGLRLRTHDPYL